MIVVKATDIKNNFGKFLKYVAANEEVIIERNGKQIAKLVSMEEYTASKRADDDTPITNSLLGVIKAASIEDLDYRKIKEEAMNEKYNSLN